MNILILTAKYGMGHYTASMSLKQELENECTSVTVIDFLDVIFPKIKNIMYDTFNFLVSKCSKIYNFLYKFSANNNLAPFEKLMNKRIEKMLNENNTDLVISTFPLCSKYISKYKKLKNCNLKLYTYITDIEVNKEWITQETDEYFAPSDESKMQIINYGVSEEKIRVVGIPIRNEFKNENPFLSTRTANKKEIIIMGGGLGLFPNMDKILENLSNNQKIHITLLVGKNQKLFDKYNNKYENITVLGYTNEVYKYMEKAELIITKAGGITLFEAIYSETPIYVLCPFLNQEIGNAKFIEENGIGKVFWDKTENLAQEILKQFKIPNGLENMKRNMKQIKNRLENVTVLDVYNGNA